MPQYAILLYAPAPADWSETPPEELEAHDRYAAQIEELGGRIVSGQTLRSKLPLLVVSEEAQMDELTHDAGPDDPTGRSPTTGCG